MSESLSPYHGIFAAALTPLNADLSPNLDAMAAHSRWLLANGCDGLAVLGTTGEANSFGLKERIGIIEGLVERGIPGDVMMPGTGCVAVPDTVELTKAAVNAGAKGVLMLPPYYYKNPSDEGLFAAFANVIDAVADDRLKVYLYHFPQMSGIPLSYNLIEMLLKAYPNTIAGMKDSSGDFDNMSGAAKAFPGFGVFSGTDQLLLPMLRVGGVGCITACANVISKHSGTFYRAWCDEGDGAAVETQHAVLEKAKDCISQFPYPPALKAMMSRHSGDDGWLNIRPPLMPLADSAKQKLFADFDALGISLPPLSD